MFAEHERLGGKIGASYSKSGGFGGSVGLEFGQENGLMLNAGLNWKKKGGITGGYTGFTNKNEYGTLTGSLTYDRKGLSGGSTSFTTTPSPANVSSRFGLSYNKNTGFGASVSTIADYAFDNAGHVLSNTNTGTWSFSKSGKYQGLKNTTSITGRYDANFDDAAIAQKRFAAMQKQAEAERNQRNSDSRTSTTAADGLAGVFLKLGQTGQDIIDGISAFAGGVGDFLGGVGQRVSNLYNYGVFGTNGSEEVENARVAAFVAEKGTTALPVLNKRTEPNKLIDKLAIENKISSEEMERVMLAANNCTSVAELGEKIRNGEQLYSAEGLGWVKGMQERQYGDVTREIAALEAQKELMKNVDHIAGVFSALEGITGITFFGEGRPDVNKNNTQIAAALIANPGYDIAMQYIYNKGSELINNFLESDFYEGFISFVSGIGSKIINGGNDNSNLSGNRRSNQQEINLNAPNDYHNLALHLNQRSITALNEIQNALNMIPDSEDWSPSYIRSKSCVAASNYIDFKMQGIESRSFAEYYADKVNSGIIRGYDSHVNVENLYKSYGLEHKRVKDFGKFDDLLEEGTIEHGTLRVVTPPPRNSLHTLNLVRYNGAYYSYDVGAKDNNGQLLEKLWENGYRFKYFDYSKR